MESLLNSSYRVPPPRRQTPSQGMRTSVILVIVGLAASALGGMMVAIASSSAAQGSGNEPLVLGLGSLLLGAGVLLFLSGLLTEFFAIGSSLRSIATSSEAMLSLLKSRFAAQSESEAQNSQPSMFPPRVA